MQKPIKDLRVMTIRGHITSGCDQQSYVCVDQAALGLCYYLSNQDLLLWIMCVGEVGPHY